MTTETAQQLRQVLEALRRVEARQQRLDAALQRLLAPAQAANDLEHGIPQPTPFDVLAALIFERWAGLAWTCREVIDRACLPQNGELAAAVRAAVGRQEIRNAAKALGKLISARGPECVRRTGIVIGRVGSCAAGALWVCRRVEAAQTHQTHLGHDRTAVAG